MKKWTFRIVAMLGLVIVTAVVLQVATGLRPSQPVGFQIVHVPRRNGAPLLVAVWYPTQPASPPALLGLTVQFVANDGPVAGPSLPLVVISHGSGGGPGSHADIALALASAGFVVAAPMHPGDNYADTSAVGTPDWLVARSQHINDRHRLPRHGAAAGPRAYRRVEDRNVRILRRRFQRAHHDGRCARSGVDRRALCDDARIRVRIAEAEGHGRPRSRRRSSTIPA